MEHILEVSPSGRATCRSCQKKIAKGELRFGEAVESQFSGSGHATEWHHIECATRTKGALVRPLLVGYEGDVANKEALLAACAGASAEIATTAPKGVPGALPTADIAPTGRAKCISCQEAIPKGSVRVAVERDIDTGSFSTKGAGYLHPGCVAAWAEGQGTPQDELIAQIAHHTALAALPPPLGDGDAMPGARASEKEKPPSKSRGKAVASDAPKSAPKRAKPTVPDFAGLDGRTLATLAAKLEKAFDTNGYKHDNLLEKANVPWNDRAKLYWHLVEHGAYAAEKNVGLLYRLSEHVDVAPPEALASLVARLPASLAALYRNYNPTQVLPEWDHNMDKLAVHAVARANDALVKVEASAAPTVRRGLAFVRGRSGMPITDEEKTDVLDALGRIEASAQPLRWFRVTVARNGSVADAFEVRSAADVAKLALRFGDEAAWGEAVKKHVATGEWQKIEQAMPGLVRVPLDELPKILPASHRTPGTEPSALFSLLEQRGDPEEAVLAMARGIETADESSRKWLKETVLVWLLAQRAAREEPLPEDVVDELSLEPLSTMFTSDGLAALRDAYLSVFRALPAPRAHALVRRMIAQSFRPHGALPILVAHFDDALLRELLQLDATNGYLPAKTFAAIGTAALPALVEAWTAAPAGFARSARVQSIVAIFAARKGEPLDAREEAALEALGPEIVDLCDQEKYWPQERWAASEASLSRFPESKRTSLLRAALASAGHPERAFRLIGTVADPAFVLEAVKTMAERASTLTNDDHFDAGARSLGAAGPELFAQALGSGGSAAFARRLEKALGAEGFARFTEKRGVAKKSWLELLRDISAEAKGERERIYLLEPKWRLEDMPVSARASSFSRLGGAGPKVTVPKRADGEPMSHVLTIDLEEAPELRARIGNEDARAVALFVPDPSSGEGYEDSVVIEVPNDAAPADGEPLFVLPLDVPQAIFDHDASRTDAALGELRKAVFNRSGWALGQPMWIQDDEGGGPGFLMQLGEALGVNCGDSGSLYVFRSGVSMQCY